jgi:CheY-like chemotaxis protein
MVYWRRLWRAGLGDHRMAQVLIIGDDPAMLRMLSLVLGTSGYEVRTSHDAYSALQMLEQQCFAAILIDLGKYSERFALEAQQRARNTSIIVMSTLSESERARIVRATYLPKPFRPERLISVLSVATRAARRAS